MKRKVVIGIAAIAALGALSALSACALAGGVCKNTFCLLSSYNCTWSDLPAESGCTMYPAGDSCLERWCHICEMQDPHSVQYCTYWHNYPDDCTWTDELTCGRKKQRTCALEKIGGDTKCRCPKEGGTDIGVCKVLICG